MPAPLIAHKKVLKPFCERQKLRNCLQNSFPRKPRTANTQSGKHQKIWVMLQNVRGSCMLSATVSVFGLVLACARNVPWQKQFWFQLFESLLATVWADLAKTECFWPQFQPNDVALTFSAMFWVKFPVGNPDSNKIGCAEMQQQNHSSPCEEVTKLLKSQQSLPRMGILQRPLPRSKQQLQKD